MSSLAARGLVMVPTLDGTVEYECRCCTRLFADKFKAESHTCLNEALTAAPMHPQQHIASDVGMLGSLNPTLDTPWPVQHDSCLHGHGQMIPNLCTSSCSDHTLLSEDPDLSAAYVITSTEDSAAFATEAWSAALNGEVPEDVQAYHATTAAAVAEYEVRLLPMLHLYMTMHIF